MDHPRRLELALLLGLCALPACGNSIAAPSGDDQLLIVHYPPVSIAGVTSGAQLALGQFFAGPFPADSGGPEVPKDYNLLDNEVPAGTANLRLTGYAAKGALSAAIGFKNLGQGYWVIPVGLNAPEKPGFLAWEAELDFSRSIPVGPQPLVFAAADANGHFGASNTADLKIDPLLPAGHVVASLSWGNNADLDLHLVAPNGNEVDPKHLNSEGIVDAGPDAGQPLPGNGQLDHDANANCVADGSRTENVVWTDVPTAGTYLVRVDMFNACGTPAASFKFTLYVDGVPVMVQDGQLLDIQADGGGLGSGLYIGKFTCDGNGKCS